MKNKRPVSDIPDDDLWSPDTIAGGILTWHIWPGFQGVHCRVRGCGCEMNVLGGSYDHKCPSCDPDGNHHYMNSNRHGMWFFNEPRYGPTAAMIRNGYARAMEISESERMYAVGEQVMLRRWNFGPWPHVKVGIIVKWNVSDSYPGSRRYQVKVYGCKEESALESDLAPFRNFDDGEMVMVRRREEVKVRAASVYSLCQVRRAPEPRWIPAKIVRLTRPEESYFLDQRHPYEVLAEELDIGASGPTFEVCEWDIRPVANG